MPFLTGARGAAYRSDLQRLLWVFYRPARAFVEIRESPGLTVVMLATLAASAPLFVWQDWLSGFLFGPGQVARAAVAAAIYLFVFNFFGKEVRYRVILSVLLHASLPVFATLLVLEPLFSLASFQPPLPEDPALQQLLFALNPLEVWRVILTGMGFTLALGVSRSFAISIVLAAWALGLAVS